MIYGWNSDLYWKIGGMGIICELDVGVGEGEKVLINKVIWHIVKNLSMFGDDKMR